MQNSTDRNIEQGNPVFYRHWDVAICKTEREKATLVRKWYPKAKTPDFRGSNGKWHVLELRKQRSWAHSKYSGECSHCGINSYSWEELQYTNCKFPLSPLFIQGEVSTSLASEFPWTKADLAKAPWGQPTRLFFNSSTQGLHWLGLSHMSISEAEWHVLIV